MWSVPRCNALKRRLHFVDKLSSSRHCNAYSLLKEQASVHFWQLWRYMLSLFSLLAGHGYCSLWALSLVVHRHSRGMQILRLGLFFSPLKRQNVQIKADWLRTRCEQMLMLYTWKRISIIQASGSERGQPAKTPGPSGWSCLRFLPVAQALVTTDVHCAFRAQSQETATNVKCNVKKRKPC